jgi:hypothetical protein
MRRYPSAPRARAERHRDKKGAIPALPVLTGTLKLPKVRAFFGVLLAALAVAYALTGWDAPPPE